LTQEIISRLKFDTTEMIEELEVEIVSSELFSKSATSTTTESIPTYFEDTSIFIDKLFETIIESSELLIQEENKFQYYQRKVSQQKKKEEESSSVVPSVSHAVPAPSRLESLLISTQIKDSIAQMESLISLTNKKMEFSNKI
jgi:hypothetical protein